MQERPELRVRWTDPRGLQAQARRASPEEGPERPPSRLDRLMSALRARGSSADEQLVELAWEAFAAGFTARDGETPPQPTAQQGRSPATTAAPAHGTANAADDFLADLVADLSPRRFEVLKLVARGLTNREISEVLGISAHTVKAHVAGLLEALDLTNRTEAAVALHEYETRFGAN